MNAPLPLPPPDYTPTDHERALLPDVGSRPGGPIERMMLRALRIGLAAGNAHPSTSDTGA